MNKTAVSFLALVLCSSILLSACGIADVPENSKGPNPTPSVTAGAQTAGAVASKRVDVDAPFDGDVVIAVNTDVSPDNQAFSGRFPLTDGDFSEFRNIKETVGQSIEGYKGEGKTEQGKAPLKTYELGETLPITTRDFYNWMQINEDGTRPENKYYDVDIELVYSGEHCTIWGQKGTVGNFVCDYSLSKETAKKIASEFDNKMFPFMTESFGTTYDVDEDGKVAIVCLDLIDYYNYDIFDNYYFNGYCDPVACFINGANDGNTTKMDAVVLDLWPTLYNEEGKTTEENWNLAMVTLIHEYQHLINYSDYLMSPKQAKPLIEWMNEGFSVIAENMYTGKPAADFVEFYKLDGDGVIAGGRSLMGYEGLWEDYALVYFFSLYLLEQTKSYEGGGKEIFKSILDSDDCDYRAVENALKKIGYPVTDFSQFLFNYRVALIANEDSGVFGFNKNIAVQNLPLHFLDIKSQNTDDLRLKGFSTMIPGGGAVLIKNAGSFVPAGQDENIRFAGITLEK